MDGRGKEVELVVRSTSPNHIDTECRVGAITTWWRFTSFYGFPNTTDRHLSWTLMSTLSRDSSLPWLCVGDFNEVLSSSEQLGGVGRNESQTNGF